MGVQLLYFPQTTNQIKCKQAFDDKYFPWSRSHVKHIAHSRHAETLPPPPSVENGLSNLNSTIGTVLNNTIGTLDYRISIAQ